VIRAPGKLPRGLVWAVSVPLTLPAFAAHAEPAYNAPANMPSEAASVAAPIMRVDQHQGYVGVAFDLPRGTSAKLSRGEGTIAVTFSASGAPTLPGSMPPLVSQMTGAPGGAVLTLMPGVQVRSRLLADRLELDLLEPGRPAVPIAAETPSRPAMARRPARPRVAASPSPQQQQQQQQQSPPPTPGAHIPAALGEHGRAARASDASDTGGVPRADASLAQPPQSAQPPAIQPSTPPAPPASTASGPSDAGAGDDAATPPLPPPRGVANATLAIAAQSLPAGDGERAAMLLPFAATVGAAAFPDGATAVIVLDERRPIDLSPLRDDDVLGRAVARLLPGATLIRLTLPAGTSPRLSRRPDGWRVAIVDAATAAKLAPIEQIVADGRLRLAAAAPGDVVAVPDDETGTTLLVGTQRGAGQAVAPARRLPGFTLREDWQGVVVEPVTDQLTMRAAPDGFIIAADARGLPLSSRDPDATAARLDAATFSRRFDLPDEPPDVLSRRLDGAIASAATAPAQSRLRPRLDVAQAMIALGLGPEAQAVVHAAITDAPQGADDPAAIALGAVASVLARRPDEAGGLDDPRLDGTDEIALWRAVRAAMRQLASPAAADALAARMPLLRAYPAPLRDQILPLALRTMALGGQAPAVTRLLPDTQDDARMELARALALAATARAGGDPDAALAALAKLSESPDRMARALAAREAVELRLVKGTITTTLAADALDRLLYAWRGDASEVSARLRVAELRRQSGQWRPAISLLRETEQLWPDRKGAIHPLLTAAFAEALSPDASARMPPLDFVALVDENPDLLPDGDAGRALAAQIADRLLTLDLPRRATVVLEKLLAATASPDARAELADRLAAARLAEGDAAGALDALARAPLTDPAPAPRAHRALIFARATARMGNPAAAAAALADLDTDAALDLRATLLEQARDWPAALAAVQAYAQKVLPPDGPLDARGADLLLREASIAAEAGDDSALAKLSEQAARRLPPGHVADMMTLLTGKPLHTIGDLPIVAREAALAGNFAATRKPQAPPAPPPAAAR
jgi:hypothetical protein